MDPRGGTARDSCPQGPNSFIFMQFSASWKFCEIIGEHTHFGSCCSLENPGSATALHCTSINLRYFIYILHAFLNLYEKVMPLSVWLNITCAISSLEMHGWGWYTLYKLTGKEMGNSSGGCGKLYFHIERIWFILAVTNSNWFLPVVSHDKWTVSGIVWLVASLLIKTLTKEVVWFRPSGLKIFITIANPCSKLFHTEVREVYQISMKQILVFRTWIVRWRNPVWVYIKLTDIVTSLLFCIYDLDKESRKCNACLESVNNINLE